MKKLLIALLATTIATPVLAQGWDYASQNSGYNNQSYQRQSAQRRYQQKQYQQQNRQYRTTQPVQRQRSYQQPRQQQNGYYQNNYQGGYQGGYYENSRSSNGLLGGTNGKQFYVTPRIGGSYVNFVHAKDDIDGAFGVFGSVAGGLYLPNQFRADIEIGYHFKREIDNTKIDFSQWDFMLNGYYDIDIGSPLTPFVGAGLGLGHMKLTASEDDYDDSSYTKTSFAASIAGGAMYPITDMIAVEGMGRGRYVFYSERMALWTLEVMAGVRFSF